MIRLTHVARFITFCFLIVLVHSVDAVETQNIKECPEGILDHCVFLENTAPTFSDPLKRSGSMANFTAYTLYRERVVPILRVLDPTFNHKATERMLQLKNVVLKATEELTSTHLLARSLHNAITAARPFIKGRLDECPNEGFQTCVALINRPHNQYFNTNTLEKDDFRAELEKKIKMLSRIEESWFEDSVNDDSPKWEMLIEQYSEEKPFDKFTQTYEDLEIKFENFLDAIIKLPPILLENYEPDVVNDADE